MNIDDETCATAEAAAQAVFRACNKGDQRAWWKALWPQMTDAQARGVLFELATGAVVLPDASPEMLYRRAIGASYDRAPWPQLSWRLRLPLQLFHSAARQHAAHVAVEKANRADAQLRRISVPSTMAERTYDDRSVGFGERTDMMERIGQPKRVAASTPSGGNVVDLDLGLEPKGRKKR